MRADNKLTQRATALALVAALGVAIYLNWQYASPIGQKKESVEDMVAAAAQASPTGEKTAVDASAADVQKEEVQPVSDGLVTEQEALDAADKNYGEAQLVSVSKDSGSEFFENARLTRTKTRDGVLDDLEKSLKKSSLSEDEKTEILKKMTDHLNVVTLENQLETLIKAKGFADCLCFLNDGKADVTVMTVSGSGLSANQVAQVRDIILSKCSDLQAQDITLVEVK